MSESAGRGGAANFNGLRVVSFESRLAAETAAMIERYGGRATVAPSMREAPLEDNQAAFEFADRILAGGFDIVILLTGVGVRQLFCVMEMRHLRAAIVAALSRVVTVARGPKPVAALRELGLEPTITIPEPNTWRELLASLGPQGNLTGKRVAVQEYGISNRNLIAGLEARGAQVMTVPVYRWTLPVDRGPLRAAEDDCGWRSGRGHLHQREPGQQRYTDRGGRGYRRGVQTRTWRCCTWLDWSRLFARAAWAWRHDRFRTGASEAGASDQGGGRAQCIDTCGEAGRGGEWVGRARRRLSGGAPCRRGSGLRSRRGRGGTHRLWGVRCASCRISGRTHSGRGGFAGDAGRCVSSGPRLRRSAVGRRGWGSGARQHAASRRRWLAAAAVAGWRPAEASDARRLPPRGGALHTDMADAPGGTLHAGIPPRPRAAFVSRHVHAARSRRRSDGYGG